MDLKLEKHWCQASLSVRGGAMLHIQRTSGLSHLCACQGIISHSLDREMGIPCDPYTARIRRDLTATAETALESIIFPFRSRPGMTTNQLSYGPEVPMAKEKWTMERVHQELSEARTKVFVTNKVLETGNLKFADYPEWGLVIEPILRDLLANATAIQQMLEEKKEE